MYFWLLLKSIVCLSEVNIFFYIESVAVACIPHNQTENYAAYAARPATLKYKLPDKPRILNTKISGFAYFRDGLIS